MSSDGLSCSTANDNDVKYYSLENMIQESKLGKLLNSVSNKIDGISLKKDINEDQNNIQKDDLIFKLKNEILNKDKIICLLETEIDDYKKKMINIFNEVEEREKNVKIKENEILLMVNRLNTISENFSKREEEMEKMINDGRSTLIQKEEELKEVKIQLLQSEHLLSMRNRQFNCVEMEDDSEEKQIPPETIKKEECQKTQTSWKSQVNFPTFRRVFDQSCNSAFNYLKLLSDGNGNDEKITIHNIIDKNLQDLFLKDGADVAISTLSYVDNMLGTKVSTFVIFTKVEVYISHKKYSNKIDDSKLAFTSLVQCLKYLKNIINEGNSGNCAPVSSLKIGNIVNDQSIKEYYILRSNGTNFLNAVSNENKKILYELIELEQYFSCLRPVYIDSTFTKNILAFHLQKASFKKSLGEEVIKNKYDSLKHLF